MMVWSDGKLMEKEKVIGPLSHSLHYGGAVFEGIRFYEIPCSRKRAIFRLEDHIQRLLASACVMGMEIPYGAEELCEAVLATIKQSNLQAGYIRPLIFRGEGIGLMSQVIEVYTMIAVLPWTDGPKSAKLATSSLMRLHSASTVIGAKIAGHYVNSYMAAARARKQGADDALLLDYEGNVAESSVANVFFVRGKKVFTPKQGNIFSGITRNTVIQLLDLLGIEVVEREISLAEALKFNAMFLTGTACEVLPVSELDDRKFDTDHPIVLHCREMYRQAVSGNLLSAPANWLTYVD